MVQFLAQHLVACLHALAEDELSFEQSATHARALSALAGEEEDGLLVASHRSRWECRGAEHLRQCCGVGAVGRQPKAHLGPARDRVQADIRSIPPGVQQGLHQACTQGIQSGAAAGRDKQHQFFRLLCWPRSPSRRRGGQHHVGVRPAEAERAHSGMQRLVGCVS